MFGCLPAVFIIQSAILLSLFRTARVAPRVVAAAYAMLNLLTRRRTIKTDGAAMQKLRAFSTPTHLDGLHEGLAAAIASFNRPAFGCRRGTPPLNSMKGISGFSGATGQAHRWGIAGRFACD